MVLWILQAISYWLSCAKEDCAEKLRRFERSFSGTARRIRLSSAVGEPGDVGLNAGDLSGLKIGNWVIGEGFSSFEVRSYTDEEFVTTPGGF